VETPTLADSQGTSTVLYTDNLETKLHRLFAESEFSAFQDLRVASLKYRFVIRFFGAEQVTDNAGEFVSSGCNCLGSAELPSNAPKELTKIVFGVMQRVRSHAERSGNATPDTAALGIEVLAATDLVLWTQSQPEREGRSISELGHICTDLA
jgi:hypothetical protein